MYKQCEEILKKLESEGKIKVLWGFEFPPKQELKIRLKDVLEDEVEEKYYLSGKKMKDISNWKAHQKPFERVMGQESIVPTLTARGAGEEHSGMIVYSEELKSTTNLQEDIKCMQVGELDIKGHDQMKRVYSGEGISPTLTCMGGGNTEPKIITSDLPRKDIKQEEKYCEYCGKQLERKRFNGRLEDFTVFKNRKYCNRECMKRDYLKIGDNHNQTYSNAHATARKINELILHKEVCELCGSTDNLDIHHIDGNWQNNNFDNLMCLCRSCHTKYEKNKDKLTENSKDFRVRKLTPRETWRLMGFRDCDFEKAAKVCSNSQLYKQAGNSICVPVLQGILRNLLKEEQK